LRDERPNLAIAHAAFLGGGAEAVTLWALQSLQERYKVSLITLLPIDLEEANRCYGTSVKAESVAVIPILRRNRITEKLYSHTSMFTARQQILARATRRRGKSFDLMISTFNEMDLGAPGIQYIHSPFFGAYSSEARRTLNFPDSFGRRFAKRSISFLFGASEQRLEQNFSVTNSHWTASLVAKTCNLEVKVLYPPVLSPEPNNAPEMQRRDGFLCVGRFGRDKRLESAIEIIDRVRARGADVDLRIVGNTQDPGYLAELEVMRKTRSSWLTFEHNITRSRLAGLMRQYHFGLQPREAEQFGIAVAEMAAGGCIPFVPMIGGQAEIVGNDPRLSFSGIQDAVDKIIRLRGNHKLREEVRLELLAGQRDFSADSFMTNFRQMVENVLSGLSHVAVGGQELNPCCEGPQNV
jgi:glycosyltransferase involved in cell wall biosynthesis